MPACPREVTYSKEDQNRAADEIEALPPESILPTFIADYGKLRDQARACRGETIKR